MLEKMKNHLSNKPTQNIFKRVFGSIFDVIKNIFRCSPKCRVSMGKFLVLVLASTFSAILIVVLVLGFDDVANYRLTCDRNRKIEDLKTLYDLKVNVVRARELSISYSIWTESNLERNPKMSPEDTKLFKDSKTQFDLDAGELKAYIAEINSYLSDNDKCNLIEDVQKKRVSEIKEKTNAVLKDLASDEEIPINMQI